MKKLPILLSFFLTFFSLALVIFPKVVFGQTPEVAEEPSVLFRTGDLLITLVLLIDLGLSVYLIKSFGKGILNIAFISFGFGILFFTLSRLFTQFQDMGIFALDDVTLHVWWHIIFYFAMASLIWGGSRLKGIVNSSNAQGWGSRDKIFYSSLLVATLIIYLIAQPLEATLKPMLVGSFVDTFGVHHFLAFLFAIVASWYLFYIKGHWGILGSSINLIIIFMVLVGLQHLWETLTESWKVISLEDSLIEQIEQFLVLPAVIIYGFALWRITKAIKG